jgi:hypothetical protein
LKHSPGSDSKELNVIPHFDGREAIAQQQEAAQYLTNASRLHRTVGNAGVLESSTCQLQKIVVMSDDDALSSQGERQMFLIGGLDQSDVGRHGNIDATSPESVGNCRIHVLVAMEAKAIRHACG